MPEAFITASAVGHAYGDRQILENIDLNVHAGDRIALAGPNGSGKSTLLRLLAGYEDPVRGQVRRARGTNVACLPQVTSSPRFGGVESEDRAAWTVRQELAARTGVAAATEKMDCETQRLVSGDTSRIGRYFPYRGSRGGGRGMDRSWRRRRSSSPATTRPSGNRSDSTVRSAWSESSPVQFTPV